MFINWAFHLIDLSYFMDYLNGIYPFLVICVIFKNLCFIYNCVNLSNLSSNVVLDFVILVLWNLWFIILFYYRGENLKCWIDILFISILLFFKWNKFL